MFSCWAWLKRKERPQYHQAGAVAPAWSHAICEEHSEGQLVFDSLHCHHVSWRCSKEESDEPRWAVAWTLPLMLLLDALPWQRLVNSKLVLFLGPRWAPDMGLFI